MAVKWILLLDTAVKAKMLILVFPTEKCLVPFIWGIRNNPATTAKLKREKPAKNFVDAGVPF